MQCLWLFSAVIHLHHISNSHTLDCGSLLPHNSLGTAVQCCVSPHLDEPHFGFLRILLDKALAILRLLSTTVQTACANLGAIYRSGKSQAHYSKYSRSRSPCVVSDWAQIKSDCAPHKVDLLELKPTYSRQVWASKSATSCGLSGLSFIKDRLKDVGGF